ncbi:ATP-grasp domain-containing protein [Halopolyspora algeriensis]|uniref:ATP-grasp domain-containing protein n=1 Tax=Halopolyspora algeriensis TaxID=1500506 RepID=A0A368VVV4_9ACTN|nr:ATP-grasp domain-containing protein [Halopolyspora algeriensis]RCW46236.1 ATP-grasp domain-containing protein [Halopolyspora algeriensis]TQM55639.1 ATP-grasp domain-containing protein [Halopolyspora algeriensis]
MPTNIFVLGLDDENRRTLESLPHAEQFRFHPLLSVDELIRGEIHLAEMLDKAEQELDSFDGTVDAIVGYWDFPVSTMVPILCHNRGLPSASLEAVLKCEHKYWSRLEQQRSIEEYPPFALVGLDDETAPDSLRYPMWVKPVKAFSSELAFLVEDDQQLREALGEIRAGIGRVGSPFDFALSHLELPPEIAEVGGQACLAEESVSGQQVTIEGYNDGETIHVYGVIDSYNYEGAPSFQRYQYPSKLPEQVIERLVDVSKRIIGRIGLRSVFNIEYFWDPSDGAINLLEINPRHSQSHAMLFEQVDGAPNHHCMVQLALGRTPQLPHRQGAYAVGAKWFYRRFSEDALVRRSPTSEEVAAVERDIPGVHVEIEAQQGTRLSELTGQDSYSYNLAVIHVGAGDEEELQDKYERCVRALAFEFEE